MSSLDHQHYVVRSRHFGRFFRPASNIMDNFTTASCPPVGFVYELLTHSRPYPSLLDDKLHRHQISPIRLVIVTQSPAQRNRSMRTSRDARKPASLSLSPEHAKQAFEAVASRLKALRSRAGINLRNREGGKSNCSPSERRPRPRP